MFYMFLRKDCLYSFFFSKNTFIFPLCNLNEEIYIYFLYMDQTMILYESTFEICFFFMIENVEI